MVTNGRSHAGPVVEVLLLVAMIVGIVVVLPQVVVGVDRLVVHVVAHVDLGEDVLELGVVMERNSREWVEVVGVDLRGLSHGVSIRLFLVFLLLGLVWRVDTEVGGDGGRVDKHVGAPAHAAERAHSVGSAHIS